ncbi:MAG: DUF885 domain-containing protein [Candidatus Eisenbacteria bacterium]|uniref:DUF885 domain-containing protein n=1 Tax=Eiseniibacteriota bacterium TaxID=2212470 RepID=A0A849SK21_UNCEI|nr:DUF885 domain-containing protein [Candidatus Eisenbacteria bacterium]
MIETVRTFTALAEEFVELYLRHHPVEATRAGIHDYDRLLPNDTAEGLRERSVWLQDLEHRLVASVPWQELPVEHRADYGILRARLSALRADLDEVKIYAKNPVLYPETALHSVFLLLARPGTPLEERKEAILERMIAIPDYLAVAKKNLQQVPDQYLNIAADVTLSAPGFVEEVCRTLLKNFPGEGERIEHAGSRARKGFLQYQQFIDQDLEAKIGGTFAIGERWMNYKLEREHLLALDCKKLDALGREQVTKVTAELEAEARRVDPSKTWKQQLEAAKDRHPEPLRLREAYVAELERARAFVQDMRIAPIGGEPPLVILDTPVFERATQPLATYLPPAPFDASPAGCLCVTPADPARRKDEQQQQIEAHHNAAISLVCVHEGYPGHHLQFGQSFKNGSRLRRLSRSPVTAQGWALYCEELMAEAGFFTDPIGRLYQLRDLLWRACRVVVDAGLHTGNMGFMQAVDYLVTTALIPRVNAVLEVRRYTLRPTEPMSAMIGKLELVALRDETRQRLGERFNLHEFHAAVLASGPIPTALLREELKLRMP